MYEYLLSHWIKPESSENLDPSSHYDLESSWNAVPPHVIINCFSDAGISDSSQQVALNDEDDPFKEWIKKFDKLREAHTNSAPENVSAENFFAVDDHVIVTASSATNSKILSQNLGNNVNSDDEIVI